MMQSVWRAFILLFAATGLGLLGNAISPRGIPLITPTAKALQPIELIALVEATELWESGAGFFLDAREPADFSAGHIPNAFNLPLRSFEEHIDEIAPMLTPESPIVVYCDGVQCELSHRVKDRLAEMGFVNVRILLNGWTVWRRAGLPVEESTAN